MSSELLQRKNCELVDVREILEVGCGNVIVETLGVPIKLTPPWLGSYVCVRCSKSRYRVGFFAFGSTGEVHKATVGSRFALIGVQVIPQSWLLQLESVLHNNGHPFWHVDVYTVILHTQGRNQEVLRPSWTLHDRVGSGHLCCYSGIGGMVSGISDVVGRDESFVLVDSSADAIACSKIREPRAFTMRAAVEDTSWWSEMIHFQPFGISASPPCPPWSGFGSKKGEKDARSASWPYLLLLVALIVPIHFVIGNVVGITKANGIVQRVQAIIDSLGYVTYMRIIDADCFAPTKRPRWFLMAVRRDVALPNTAEILQMNVPWNAPLVTVADCLDITANSCDDAELLWTPSISAMYQNISMIPWRGYARVVNVLTHVPTVLRKYGHAHEFPLHRLQRDSLHGFGVRCGTAVRFAKPCEVAALLGYGDCHMWYWQRCVDNPVRSHTTWWQGLGDSVSPLVGSFVWSLLCVCVPPDIGVRLAPNVGSVDIVRTLMTQHQLACQRRRDHNNV